MLKDVEGFPNYAVDEHGNVWNMKRIKKLKPYLNRVGYPRVKLCNNNHQEQFFVHLLVFKTFTGATNLGKNGIFIDHIDRIKTHNSLTNLRAVTLKQNLQNRRWKTKVIDMPIPYDDPYAAMQTKFFIKEVK